jgi:hypothetical protein
MRTVAVRSFVALSHDLFVKVRRVIRVDVTRATTAMGHFDGSGHFDQELPDGEYS